MSRKGEDWTRAREIEELLERNILNALRECGASEDLIDDVGLSRSSQPESILPETDREIEWRIRESRRMARYFGLHIPNLTD